MNLKPCHVAISEGPKYITVGQNFNTTPCHSFSFLHPLALFGFKAYRVLSITKEIVYVIETPKFKLFDSYLRESCVK